MNDLFDRPGLSIDRLRSFIAVADQVAALIPGIVEGMQAGK